MRRLTEVDEAARALGLFAGQKATDAAALVPELRIAEAEPQADADALLALADWCERFSPAVAPDPPAGLFLDITGAAHLWGGEAAMMDDLLARLAANGLPAQAAIAPTPGAAWALARFGFGRPIVSEAQTARALAPLPVAALRLDDAAAAQIVRLGLTTVEALVALPPGQVLRRFGPEPGRRLDQALGRAPEALRWRRPPTPWLAHLAFAEPISVADDLARASEDIAGQLCARLEAAGKGARRFEIAFHGVDRKARRLAVGLSLAGRDPAGLARLFRPRLETIDPGFGIEAVTLAAAEVEALGPRQRRLDQDPEAALEEGIAPLVDRLSHRLGPGAVWRPEAHPSHAPERAVRRRPPLSPPGPAEWDADRPRPLRLFARPEPIEAMAEVPDDPPVFFRWRGRPHRIRRAEGPERLAEEWWRPDAGESRDYYRVEDEAGARFWLFRAGRYGAATPPRWWLHGLFP